MATPRIDEAHDIRSAITEILQSSDHDLVAALRKARAAALAWPDVPAAHRILAFILRKGKRTGEANQVDLAAIALSERHAGLTAAREAWAAGRREEAEILIRSHLRRDPEDAYAAKLLADIALRVGAFSEAETFYNRSLTFAPGYHDARLALALLLSRTGRLKGALAAVDAVLDPEPGHFDGLLMKAGLLSQGRQLEEADELFQGLVIRYPDNAAAWLNYAYLLKTIGRIDESVAAYRRATVSDKTSGLAWFGLANLKTVTLTDSDIATMREALLKPMSHNEEIHIRFALGKALDDHDDFAAAFEQYSIGNTMRRATAPYDAAETLAQVRRVEQTFTPELMRLQTGSTDADPIFIVSLPRSGSTLVEQILASHPQIEGTEELYEIEGSARSLGRKSSPNAYLDLIASASDSELKALGDEYIIKTRRYRMTNRPYFTDKMPGNWRFVGLIHKILPNAKIIDVRRHPLGCGLANLTQHFSWGIDFSYDQVDIAKYYAAYVRQMSHFDRVLPGVVHRLHYESLIENLEYEVRRLLDYLNLPFADSCLRFYETNRAVHTPSAEQVRKPINRDGVERWRHYEPWLAPLKGALGPVLDNYPYVPEEWPD